MIYVRREGNYGSRTNPGSIYGATVKAAKQEEHKGERREKDAR